MSDETLAKIEKALDMVTALCKSPLEEGSREWVMSIPARPDYDPDLVIADALGSARKEIERLRIDLELERGRAERGRR